MTICIAALCEKGENIIVVSDRMVTVGDVIEFEHEVTKFEQLTNNSVILTAGSATIQSDIIKNAKSKLDKLNDIPFEELNSLVKNSYLEVRNNCCEELFLKPIGLNLEAFYKNQRAFLPEFVFKVLDNIHTYRLELSLVLTGFDERGGNIQLIEEPGTSESYNSVGFCAVGSGSLNAISTFTLHNYAPSFKLEKALYLAFASKKNAERAPGVGEKNTDILIISKTGITKINEAGIELLNKIYNTHSKIDDKGYQEVKDKLINKITLK
jgi:20S proteasome alpha/beta subunit